MSGVGLNADNTAILSHVEGVCAFYRMPIILAGDFNVTPAMLYEAGILQKMDLTWVTDTYVSPTCNGRVYDTFYVSRHLVPTLVKLQPDPNRHHHKRLLCLRLLRAFFPNLLVPFMQ